MTDTSDIEAKFQKMEARIDSLEDLVRVMSTWIKEYSYHVAVEELDDPDLRDVPESLTHKQRLILKEVTGQ